MLVRKTLAGIGGAALLSIGVAVPALPAQAATGCVPAIGVCSSRFCSTASFSSGYWYLAFLGGRFENTYWDAYSYDGAGGYIYYGEVSPSGC